MVELVLDKLLNRYLLMGLRANLSVVESVTKCKQVNTTLAPVFIFTKCPHFRWWSCCLAGGFSRLPRS